MMPSKPSSRPSLQDTLRGVATLPQRLAEWRGRRRASPLWTLLVAAILAFVILPVATIVWLSLARGDGTWTHLAASVLPSALLETGLLLAGVGLVTLCAGTGAAWLVTMHRFVGREIVDWLLVLPLAMPTYIVAYAYVELLDYAGPAQSGLRHLMGWRTRADYWFPDIRSLPGAILVISSVLYPYVYLSARASFVQQSVCVLEVARTLGRTPVGAFTSVALPLARPALAAGLALVLMECLSDLGAVEHLGIRTLTATIAATWLQRSSLSGAAQIAAVMLLVVLALMLVERYARGAAQFHHTTGRFRSIPFADLAGWRAALALAGCLLPVIVGFLVPALVLLAAAVHHWNGPAVGALIPAALNSLLLSTLAACAAVLLAVALAFARRVAANGFTRPAVHLASLGYALPGTVLAIGLLIPLAAFDNWLDALMRRTLGVSTGLLISGTIVALVLAYAIRFLAIAFGTVEAGLERISPNLDAAARALGETALQTLRRIHLPLLLPALGSAALLVFVDTMKELPATLLLRPFDFNTLATQVYDFASLERFEEAALGALIIVAAGLLPVLLLHRTIAAGRAGG